MQYLVHNTHNGSTYSGFAVDGNVETGSHGSSGNTEARVQQRAWRSARAREEPQSSVASRLRIDPERSLSYADNTEDVYKYKCAYTYTRIGVFVHETKDNRARIRCNERLSCGVESVVRERSSYSASRRHLSVYPSAYQSWLARRRPIG